MGRATQQRWNQYVQALGTATNSLSALITKAIIEKDAIDTTFMKNTTVIKIVKDKSNKRPKYVEIDTTFYYKFVDQGTRFISRRDMTLWMRNQPTFKKEMERITSAWYEWNIIKEIE